MLLILGLGYSGQRIAQQARAAGLQVMSVRRTAAPGIVAFTDPALPGLMQTATHILSSVPPDGTTGADPVLGAFGPALAAHAGWIGYLSSTGVYGDTGGAWVDEAAPVGQGRRSARAAADLGWLALGAAVFRLPGIYGPGRSAFDQLQAGTARRVDRPGHRFNRIHVDDIAGAVLAALQAGWRGPLNVVDDLPEEPRRITEFACGLAGTAMPPLAPIDDAGLSPMARGFWTERRLISGHRLRTALGYRLRHPDYKAGLTAIWRGQGR